MQLKLIYVFSVLFTFLTVTPVFGLVDYSDSSSFNFSQKSNSQKSENSSRSSTKAKSGARSKIFNIYTTYETLKIKNESSTSKINIINVVARLDTSYSVFLESSYHLYSNTNNSLTNYKKGNIKALLGFNWLNLGPKFRETMLDIYAGSVIGNTDSDYSTSRNDTFIGIETRKNFFRVVVGLGYEARFTGTVKNSSEMKIGNIFKSSAFLGWAVSNDIKIQVEGVNVKIQQSDDSIYPSLNQDISFNYLSPRLFLGIIPNCDLTIGATYSIGNQIDPVTLAQARLWDLNNGMGNSIYAGVNVSM